MKKNLNYPWKRRRRPHAQIHLPPLNGIEALLVAEVLTRMAHAIWRAHGDTMGDILYGRGCITESSNVGPTKTAATHAQQQDDIEF